MAKQLNVNVAVTADTSAAKAQLQSLQSTLSQLSTSSTNLHLGLNTSDLNKAISDVDKLQAHLKNATNANGLLDFGKLNTSIQRSGTSLTEYGNQLLKLGPQGQQAFNQLTQAITKSEVPVNRMKTVLGEFGTVLGNTIKWQAASSAIHGMMGSIQHAFSYAKQLNESLNRIQIVTQASNEHMAQFAEQANKAAKALSTTTTAYTNASLIYYQQGLNDKQVAERTATTIKMANVSGQSAEKVSNQMTAIWNNFDDGTKSLEYYADVITALGAATASSSEEIATGLQKFAAVADTVGLSYDHATAALATITAQTRQSADTVGTGLRTLFARLQSLSLGETLDDGVTLTKYSKALDTIGVKVIDMSGNLRRADDILADMGAKWQDLSSAQKTALAQTVGGVRQYTTIMSLMDNFDVYQQNLKIAANSKGTIQAQADIYAKSWEAAQKRVKASAESIYSDLINDDFFIGLNNGFATFLDILDQIIDGFGGLKTLLPMIGAALTNLFSSQISTGMVNFANSLAMFKPGYAKAQAAERNTFLQNASQQMIGVTAGTTMTAAQKQQAAWARADLSIQQNYARNVGAMTAFDRQLAQMSMDKFTNLRLQQIDAQQRAAASQFRVAEARGTLAGVNATGMNTYVNLHNLDSQTRRGYEAAQEYELQRQFGNTRYFADSGNGADNWYATNGAFLRTNYSGALQASGDIDELSRLVGREANLRQIFGNLKQTGTQGLTSAGRSLAHAGFSRDEISNFMSQIYDRGTKQLDTGAIDSIISGSSAEQSAIVSEFATKWNMSAEAVRNYADAIVAANGDAEKEKELVEQIKQARSEAEQNTKANKQIQTAQQITKYAMAMQSAVAAGSSFAAVTENIRTNLENGDSVFDNFGSTLSGVTSGLMSAAMTMAAIPGPAGVIIAVVSTLIGVLSQIPEVTDFVHGLFTSEDQLAVEKAEEAAKQIQEDFEEAKQKAAEFLDATGTHNGLVEQINQCIRGTEEFKQAVIEANMYAKQMMQDYSLSLDDFQRNEDGALVLKDGVVKSRQAALEAQRDNLEIMNAYSQYEVQRTKYQKAENKISSILNEDTFGVYHEGTKDDHHGGWDAVNVSDFLNEYIESGSNLSFEEYYKDRGGSGIASSYRQLNKQIKNLGYTSIDEYIEAGKQYGSASSLKFDGIVSELFNNIATSQVFNKDKDLNISSFLSDYLGTSENGELIRDATLQDWTRNNLGAFSKVREAAGIKSVDISDAETFTNLYDNVDFLRKFLEIAGNFDAADLANMDIDQLQIRANSFISAQKGLEIFEKNYETLTNDAGVKLLAKTGEKKQSEQQKVAEATKISLQRYDEMGEENLSDEQKLLRDYYQNWLTQFQEAKETMVQNAIDLFAEDEFYKINETDTDEQKAKKEQAQKDLRDSLTATISNSSLTDEEVANALNLGRQIKNVLKDAFEPQQFADFFNESKSQLTELYQSIDWTSQVSAFFDVTRIKERIGNSGTEIANEINSLYEILLDENHLNGKSGLFSQIFQEESFQKELQNVQKEFKKTGKVSSDNIKDIAKQCTDLDEAIENNIFSTEALADAMELYSMGAIQSVDEITNALWNALEQANGLEKALSTAFKHIDEWNPDRSITDIDKHYANVSKDYFNELESGTTGGNRLYQDAAELFNQTYADNLRTFFYNQERTGSRHEDNPQARYYDYKNNFEAFDTMMQQVQSTGDLSKYFAFMMNGQNQAKISEYMGIDNAKEALEKIGFSMGNAGDVELNTEGKTTNGLIQQLMSALNLSEEQASMIVSEYAGHSSAVSADLQTNDFISGLWQLAGKNGEIDFNNEQVKDYMAARGNNLSADLMMQSLATQFGYGDIIENGGTQEDVLNAFATAIEAAGDTDLGKQLKVQAEAYRQQAEALEELQKVQEQQKKVKDEVSGHGAYEKGEDGKYEGASEEANAAITKAVEQNRIEGGAKNSAGESVKAVSDQAIEDLQTLGMTGQNAFETITNGNDALVHSFTDQFGNVHDVLIEGAKDYQEYQEKVEQASKELVPEANKLFGKQLFQGFLDGIKEVIASKDGLEDLKTFLEPLEGLNNLNSENVTAIAESFSSLCEKINSIETGKLTELIDALQALLTFENLTIDLTTNIDPKPEDVHHLRDDLQDMQQMAAIDFKIKVGDESGINTIKSAKTAAVGLQNSAHILVTLEGPQSEQVSNIESIANKISELNPTIKVTVVMTDENGEPIGAYTYDALTGDKTLEQTNGSIVTTNDSYLHSALNNNDRLRANELLYQDDGYHGNDMYYDAQGINTGIKIVDVANGSIDAIGNAVGNATGEVIAETAKDSEPVGGAVRNGENRIGINGQTYDLTGTQYDAAGISSLMTQLAAAQRSYNDSNASIAERNEAASTIEAITNALSELAASIEKNVKPEESSESKGQQNKQETTNATAQVSEISVGDQTVSVPAKAEVTEAEDKLSEPVEVDAKANIEGSDDQTVDMDVNLNSDPENINDAIAEAEDTKDVLLDGNHDEIDEYINTTATKMVDLKVGDNEPERAIANLPPSHSLDLEVTVHVSASNSFGTSVGMSGGGEILSSAIGNTIQFLAREEAVSSPAVQHLIEETRKHMQDGGPGCHTVNGQGTRGTNKAKAAGGMTYHSYVNGSSNRYSKPGLSLTAEEGPEIIWNKQEGYSYIVGGEGHPEFAYLRPGDRVFNANDTRQILNYHRPKSNYNSPVIDPRDLDDTLFGSHASGYGSYGPDSSFKPSRTKEKGSGGDKYERKKFYDPERYHLLTRQIADATFWYDELKKARERAYGTNVLKAIDKEIAQLDKLKAKNNELMEEAQNYLTTDLALLSELGIQYELDAEGNLANYKQLQELYEKPLTTGLDENGEKIEDEQLDELQERWNAIEKYEETLDKIREIKEELSDLKYEIADLEFEKIELEFNMKLDMTDKQLDLIDYFMSKLTGGAADAAEMLALASQKMDMLAQKAQTATDAINSAFVDAEGNQLTVKDATTGKERNMNYNDFLAMSAEERSALNLSDKAGQMIESQMSTIQQCLEDLEALKTKGLEAVSAAIDELTAKVEKQISIFDHYNNMLSTLRNITDLQGIKITKELRQTLMQLDESMIQVSKDRITAEKDKYEGLSKMAEDLRAKVKQYTGVDEELRQGYQAELDKIESQMRESMENVLSMYQQALQTAKDMFEATMDEIKEDYNASLSDIYNTTQLMQDAFDRKTAISDQYVDEYESYYKLNKLQRQINKDIDNQMANGNRANKNLKKLLSEIQKLQEDGVQLTSYDLELLEKKYEYEKALVDLEDARNAKQTIRLQRDRNGNWGYVYTAADETDLEEYQQAIEDKLYDYTQTATQQAKDLEKELLSIWIETGEKIAQLRMEGAPDSAINDLIADTQKRADFLTEQLKKAGEDIGYVLPDWIDLTQNESFDLSLDDFKETVLSYITGIEDVEAVSQKMMKAIVDIAKETKMAVDTYNASIEEINAFVSGGTGDFNAAAQAWASQITSASKENVQATKEAVDDMVKQFKDVLKEASAFENKFFNEIRPFIQQQEQLLIQLTDAISQLKGLPSNLEGLSNAAAIANGQATATQTIDENGHTQTQITYLDEGGYTGEWGPGGKLAVLHEKENVFNKKDTANLLSAANILRTLDLQAGSFSRGLGDFFSPSVKEHSEIFEQNVNITAEFPNAVNHSEIEEAFNNLANRATQYANRKVS